MLALRSSKRGSNAFISSIASKNTSSHTPIASNDDTSMMPESVVRLVNALLNGRTSGNDTVTVGQLESVRADHRIHTWNATIQ